MATVEDIRIYTGFMRSRKVRRLRREFGDSGIIYLLNLWLYAAENRPKGAFDGYDEGDIADAAGFDGDANFFVGMFCDLGFLDKNGDGFYALHNWRNRQPWVYFADDRSEKARRAAEFRWNPEKQKKAKSPKKKALKKKEVNQDVNATRIADRNAPYPYPSPSGYGYEDAKDAESFRDSTTFASRKMRVFTGPESIGSVLAKNGFDKKGN